MQKFLMFGTLTTTILLNNFGCFNFNTNLSINSPKGNLNEDAEDIASKLWNKTIKIDSNVFLNKNIKNTQAQFNTVIVKEKILTKNEVKYVFWGDLKINIARWYKNGAHFSVKKDGAICTGTDTVDASINETTAQVASKLNNKDINLNLSYWNNKQVNPNLAEIRNIIVNEKLLSKAEASLITKITNPITIKGAGYILVTFVFNNGKTTATANNHLRINNDGKNASQIAGEINNKYFGLKTDSVGQYADSDYITKNWENLLTYNYGINNQDAFDTYLPHLKLQADNKNVAVKILKDGQTAEAHVELHCKTTPYIYYYTVNSHFLQAYVNLNADMVENLQTYFKQGHSSSDDLGYFYQLLDNGSASTLPSYSGKDYVLESNILENNLGSYGDTSLLSTEDILSTDGGQADTSNNGNARFENNLYSLVMQSKGNLSLAFEWEYQTKSFSYNFTTIYYSFW